MSRAFFLLLGNCNRDIATVFDDMADGFEPSLKTGDTHCRRSHVYAAPGLAQVERNPNHTNLLRSDAGEDRVGCWSHDFQNRNSLQSESLQFGNRVIW